tara:strand:+ start:5930 stop:6430 length:501 start_codon:yes stop_codon:yes gene_type:complete
MSTRARIGFQKEDGSIIGAYQHFDGYPGGLGYLLVDHWEDSKKTESAIKLGDASFWRYCEGKKIDFDNRSHPMYEIQNVYYGRDRGEKDVGAKTYKDEKEYLSKGFNSGEDYIYLLKDTGDKDYLGKPKYTWFYTKYDQTDSLKPLENDAIKDKIEMLKYHLKENK